MKQNPQKWISSRFGIFCCLLAIGAVTYLPMVGKFGFYKDDWYLMYDALVMGPSFFSTIFAIDRPLRAPLQFALYSLFADTLILYHFSALVFRVVGAFAFHSILKYIVGGDRRLSFVGATLFLIYPGFLSQPNAVDFQAHIVSLMLAMISVSLSIQSLHQTGKKSWVLVIASVTTAWLYLGLMEYFIGIEVFRFAALFYLAQPTGGGFDWRNWAHHAKQWVILAIGPMGFLGWRMFFFEGGRKATDITGQLSAFLSQPALVGPRWLTHTVQDAFNATIGAWVVPFYQLYLPLRLRDQVLSLTVGIALAALIWIILWAYPKQGPTNSQRNGLSWWMVLALLGGIFPVILVNRQIDFADYSRYSLPAMAAAIVLLAILLSRLSNSTTLAMVVSSLVLVAGTTHVANATNYVAETTATRNFWWQVYWRAPGIKPDTTLLVEYPNIAIQEDYFVWGPANLIYAPQAQSGDTVQVPIEAVVLNQDTLAKIDMARSKRVTISQLRRGNQTEADLRKLMVITQPAENACVRIWSPNAIVGSNEIDRPEIQLVAEWVNPIVLGGEVDETATPPLMPAAYFGNEPEHGWCYYYQKAMLAYSGETQDWQSVRIIMEEALEKGLYPADSTEWYPLLQAYSAQGETAKLKPYISILGERPLAKRNACSLLWMVAKDESTKEYVHQNFCE